MGRAGSGSNSGNYSSGSGHSVDHSSGGHRIGSSHSRAGTNNRNNSSNELGNMANLGLNMLSRRGFSRYGRYGGYDSSYYGNSLPIGNFGGGGIISTIVILIIVAIVLFSTMGSSGSTKSTINREKIKSGNAYMNDCIVDEIGWFSNTTATSTRLKKFYDKTGVQPYIYLKAYDSALTSDAQKNEWAKNYYESNFKNQNIFLFVYFGEQNVDDSVGYMSYVNGYETSSVMDAEAVSIFWGNIDKYWYSNMSTDDMFSTVFEKTGDTIMKVSTTSADIIKIVVIGVIIIIIIGLGIYFFSIKRKAEKERAQETERILNTSMKDLSGSYEDDLTKKYD